MSFTITIPSNEILDLSSVTWQSRQATGANNERWVAFKTSLDSGMTYSEIGVIRNGFTSGTSVDLSGATYQGLTNQTVTFSWYAGANNTGTADSDFDSVVINGTVTPVPEPSAFGVIGLIGGMALILQRRK